MKNASRRRRLLAAATTTALVSGGAVALAGPATAQQATGGEGRYLQQIQWMDFGEPGQVIPASGTTKTEHIDLGGQDVALTCEIGPQTGGSLTTYRSGSWRGDALDDLYNSGGTGAANQLTNALVTADGETPRFDFSCSATVNGAPLALGGLVFADAEQSDPVEWIAATAPASATWRIIDRYRTPGCTGSNTATVDAQNRLQVNGSTSACATGPSAVAFLDGATSASDVALRGGGRSAIALGVVLTAARSDDPGTYGGALHLQQPSWRGGDGITAAGTRISDDSFELATLREPAPRLGARADTSDGLTLPASLTTWPGQQVRVPVSCSGEGDTVAAWADWDQDGVYDDDERVTGTCTDDAAALTWTVPDDVASGDLHIRTRIATDPAELADPSGLATDGEVESHTVAVVRPVPSAEDDTATTEQNTPVDVDVLANDEPSDAADATFDADSLHLLDGDGRPVDTLAVVGGSAEVRDGTVRFAPTTGFSGTAGAVTYTVRDSTGQRATAELTVGVTAVTPTASDDTASLRQGGSVEIDVLANDTAGNTATPLDPSSLQLLDGTAAVNELTVADQGTYRVQDGRIHFDAVRGFTGTTTPVTYAVADTDGSRTTATLTMTVAAVTPTAADDAASVRQGGTVDTDVLANDSAGDRAVPLDPATLSVAAGEQDGVGTFRVVDGEVRFVAAPSFSGEASTEYTVRDANGTPATATLTVDVTPVTPTATADAVATEQGDAVRVPVLDDDAPGDPDVPLDPATVVLLQDGAAADTVSEPGVGTWTVDEGAVVFTPEPAFSGVTSVGYRVADVNGTPAEATVTVTVTAVVPVAAADEATTDQGVDRTVDVLGNDRPGRPATPIDASTLALVAPSTAERPGAEIAELPLEGQGTWTVTDDHRIRFAPETAFTGPAQATYVVQDANGTRVTATVTVDVRAAELDLHRDVVRGTQGERLTVRPLENDRAVRGGALDPSSLRLSVAEDVRGATVSDDGRSLTIRGEGRWTVGTATAEVSFQPEPEFVGRAHVVRYTVANEHGVTGSASIAATIDAAPVEPTAPAELAFTGATLPIGALIVAALMTGLGMLLHRRRSA